MRLANPYYTIFKENNWFLNQDKLCYSDEDVSITNVILNIPFKDDQEYNKKILLYLDKFLQILHTRLGSIENPAKIMYLFDENEKIPINVSISFVANNIIQVLKI